MIISIGLALYAQSTIKNYALGAATLPLFAGAIALAVLASIGLPALPLAQPSAPAFEKLGKQYLIGMAVAFGLMVLGVLEFLKGVTQEDSSPTGWVFYALSALVFGLAFIPFGRMLNQKKTSHSAAATTSRADKVERVIAIVLFVALAGAALLVRLNLLSEFPDGVWFDEGANGLVSLKMLQDPAYRPLYVDVTQMPAHFNFIIAFLFQIFGVNIGAVRLAPTIFGVAAVAFTFLLFRRWFNTPVAVFAAAMFAVMRYSLTLSRFGVNGQTNAAFMVISLYFLDRAVRNKKLLDFALAGLVIGMGLNFYYAFRLYAAIVIGFGGLCALIWLVMQLARRNAGGRSIGKTAKSWVMPVAVMFSGIFVALAPVIQFAARNPEQFFIRTATVSIFEKRDEPDLAKALTSNITKHVLMWNVKGDGNGRHNIPGEPMLDPVMGALAVLGMGYAAARAHRARNFLMVILFVGMLMGGILSVDFEAPQAYRSNGTMLPIVYFAALPMALMAQAIGQAAQKENVRRMGYALAAVGAGVLLFNMGQFNLNAFFNLQRKSAATWLVQSPGSTFAGREMLRLAKDYDFVISALFAGDPPQKFIAPDVNNYKVYTQNDLLSFGENENRGVAYLLDGSLNSTYELLKEYFPTAQFKELLPPGGGLVVAYSVAISPEEVRNLLGATADIYANDSFDGEPIKSAAMPGIAANWTTAPPDGVTAQKFAAEFRSTLFTPRHGAYKFSVSGAPDAEIFVNEFKQTSAGLVLGRGNHAVRVRVKTAQTRNKLELLWSGPDSGTFNSIPRGALLREPVTNSGLLGAYYPTKDWSGSPAFTQMDSQVSFYFHILPLKRPYTVEWKGKVLAPQTGTYSFATRSIDESSVKIDDKPVVVNAVAGSLAEGKIRLEAGWHDIVMQYADYSNYTNAYLYWTPPDGGQEIIPSKFLRPPMGSYPDPMKVLQARQAISPNIVRVSKTGDSGGLSAELFKIVLPTPAPATAPKENAQPVPVSIPKKQEDAPAPAAPQPAAGAVPQLKMQPLAVVGRQGAGNAEFESPRSVRIGKDGRLFVADSGNKRVQILNSDGAFVSAITQAGGDVFSEPVDVVIAKNGELIVLDADRPRLFRFDQDGKFLGFIDLKGAPLYKQRGFAVDDAGNFYIANTGYGQLLKFSPEGSLLAEIGEKGKGNGLIAEPNSVSVGDNGLIYLVDAQGQQVIAFGADGKRAFYFTISPASAGVGPHLVVAKDGTLLMTATEPRLIRQYSAGGELLAQFGEGGQQAGQFMQPTGIDRDGDIIWVAETENNRLQKLKLEK